jgi:Tol biopolymer transport system component
MAKPNGLVVAAVACGLIAAWMQSARGESAPQAKVETEQLWALPPQYPQCVVATVFSEDSRHIAMIVRQEQKKMCVYLDGSEGPNYDTVQEKSFVFSPDGKRWAYAAQKGDRWVEVVDGIESEYDHVQANNRLTVFSPDSKHLAYAAARGNKWFMMVDGREEPGYGLQAYNLMFTPDSKRLACAVQTRGGKTSWMVMIDGKSGPVFDDIGHSWNGDNNSMLYSPDGRSIVYAACKDGEWSLMTDAGEVPGYKYSGKCTVMSTVVSADGKRVAHAARRGDANWFAVIDGAEGPVYNRIANGTPLFSPDGKRVVYAAQKGQKWVAVLDGQAGPEYDFVAMPVFSPDGKHLAYVAAIGATVWGEQGKWFVVMDGQPGPERDEIRKDALVFSAAGGHIAYAARKGRDSMVMIDGNGWRAGAVASGTLSFSADGKHVACLNQNDSYLASHQARVIVDGCWGPVFQNVLQRVGTQMSFAADGAVEYLAADDAGMLCRVKQTGK